jgi:hypothetical protein
MKKVFLLLILLATIVSGQDFMQSLSNNRYTILGSSATFTGTWEDNHGLNSLTVVARSDKNSAASGWKVQFSQRGVTIDKEYQFSYTANDTLTNSHVVPMSGKYFRVIYTNTNSAQTSFTLTTYLTRTILLPITSDGKIDVSSSITGNVTVAADPVTFGDPKTTSEFIASSVAASTEWYGKRDTTSSTNVDTTLFTGHTGWAEAEVTTDSTLEISKDGSFPSGNTLIIPATTIPIKIPKWDLGHGNKLFIRRYLGGGTATFYLRAWTY